MRIPYGDWIERHLTLRVARLSADNVCTNDIILYISSFQPFFHPRYVYRKQMVSYNEMDNVTCINCRWADSEWHYLWQQNSTGPDDPTKDDVVPPPMVSCSKRALPL